MKSTPFTMTAVAAMIAVFGVCGPAIAQADDPEGYGDGYQSGAYGRIRSADGGATITRADGERGESDHASVNAPLFPGDMLRTDGSQRVEVQLAGGTTVRIDFSGEVVFQSLPNPSAKFQDNTVIALNAGVIRIESNLGEKEEFRIDTRAASVYLLGEGEFRIATDDRGGLRLASLRGVAEVVSNDASVLVRGGMGTSAVAGSTPAPPLAYFASASDGFDRWCDSRDDTYRVHDRSAEPDDEPTDVPVEVRPYQTELSIHGRWTVDPEYGSVWYPTAVPYGWRPYTNGYWSYGHGGYFWVSSEPWGWAPYHYGNWQWTLYRGWCWVPGPVFAGAWVSWSWGAAHVGWAPLDYWGRPGWVGGPYHAGYYDPGCWTFVGYGNLSARNVHRYAVPIDTVRAELPRAVVVARGPRVDPRRVATSPEWRERAVREVVEDRASRMRPTRGNLHPERRLSDVQNQMMRRSPQVSKPAAAQRSSMVAPSVDPRTNPSRARRILDDPRSGASLNRRPETRDDVRDLYQRMSRPRETRGQSLTAPRNELPSSRRSTPRAAPGNARPDAPRTQGPRAQAPKAPQAPAPKAETPRAEAPRAKAQQPKVRPPRASQPGGQRSQAAPKARPKNGDKR